LAGCFSKRANNNNKGCSQSRPIIWRRLPDNLKARKTGGLGNCFKSGKREKGYQNEFHKMLAATYIEFSSEI
jgi:hypothetical protein